MTTGPFFWIGTKANVGVATVIGRPARAAREATPRAVHTPWPLPTGALFWAPTAESSERISALIAFSPAAPATAYVSTLVTVSVAERFGSRNRRGTITIKGTITIVTPRRTVGLRRDLGKPCNLP